MDPAALFSARIIVQQYVLELILLNLLRSTGDLTNAVRTTRAELLARIQFRMRLEGDEMPGIDPLDLQAAGVKLTNELFGRIEATLAHQRKETR